MEINLAVATLLGGIAALWYFWDKIIAWFRSGPSTTATSIDPATLIADLIAELERNRRLLDQRTFATAPAIRDDAWNAAQRLSAIAGPLRASLIRCRNSYSWRRMSTPLLPRFQRRLRRFEHCS